MFMNICDRFPYAYEFVYFTCSYLGRIFGSKYYKLKTNIYLVKLKSVTTDQIKNESIRIKNHKKRNSASYLMNKSFKKQVQSITSYQLDDKV